MTDLRSDYLGLQLRSPIVASAGPLTGDVAHIIQLEQCGAAAVVLPSLFEEQIEHEADELDRLHSLHNDSFVEATSFFPDADVYDRGIDSYYTLISDAKASTSIPVIASLNGTHVGGWVAYAHLVEEAGADALEVNLYDVPSDPAVSGAALEAEHIELAAMLTEEVSIPVAVKISPQYSSLASFVPQLERAGAAGVVMFNRFYLPDLDLETLQVTPRLALSTPEELRMPLRWTGILRDHLSMSIAGSSGVHSGFDVAKLLLAGADVAMTTSALLRHGPEHLQAVEAQLRDWMSEHDYQSVAQMRGAVSRASIADPSSYERGNYIGNLASFTSSFLGIHPIDLKGNQ